MRRLAILAACVAVLPLAACQRGASKAEPYLLRMTTAGDGPAGGVIEECVDPAGALAQARAIAEARPAGAPSPMAGCTRTREKRADGSTHSETRCDRAAGARASYRMISDGTPGDLRTHMETYGFDPTTGAPKTRVRDTRAVRLGPCPHDLKPGQMRMPDGSVLDTAKLRAQVAQARAAGGAQRP